jgi:hypothetical protein
VLVDDTWGLSKLQSFLSSTFCYSLGSSAVWVSCSVEDYLGNASLLGRFRYTQSNLLGTRGLGAGVSLYFCYGS